MLPTAPHLVRGVRLKTLHGLQHPNGATTLGELWRWRRRRWRRRRRRRPVDFAGPLVHDGVVAACHGVASLSGPSNDEVYKTRGLEGHREGQGFGRTVRRCRRHLGDLGQSRGEGVPRLTCFMYGCCVHPCWFTVAQESPEVLARKPLSSRAATGMSFKTLARVPWVGC